ncbi:hypothetical protein GCM10028803_16800 [Larkinella knui]|uniref:Cytochrome c n=1 Tax=Larkinella knui TaxID=2025310 RepID=A0A3P1CUM2_9BACT|nr:c-type cytochrome [Larkinella knui]RRB16800.1 cytochrome c [Larkinella knui]
MLRKLLKWSARLLLLMILLAIAYYTKAWIATENRRSRHYDVKADSLRLSADSATLAKGKRLMTVKGCDGCHGKDLGGQVLFDKPGVGRLVARNLTRGKGGLRPGFGPGQWALAIRHGLRHDQTPLIYMPSNDYNQLGENDLKAIIAYGSQVPPVDHELPPTEMGPVARVLTDLGKMELFAAEKIDHSLPLAVDQRAEISAAFGQYVATVCTHCHQSDLKGGSNGPAAPNISSTGRSSKWTDEQFFRTLRTGIRPDGTHLKPGMPWEMTKAFSDVEMRALRLYLKSV